MNIWKNFLQKLKEWVFRKELETNIEIHSDGQELKKSLEIQVNSRRKNRLEREPYFVQIGFDFGTAYSKCVCRDVITNKAWVYIPYKSDCNEYPFLIPSSLLLRNGKLSHVENPGREYQKDGLYYLKYALGKVSLCEWNDPILDLYRKLSGISNEKKLVTLVENCTIYFLAGVFGEIRNQIKERFPYFGLHKDDYMAVNLAVPVADAEHPQVNRLYQNVLCNAWALADQFKEHPAIDISEVERSVMDIINEENKSHSDICFIYPETSANVQGFVRSRVSRPGIYLFSDTGAGTVNQSVFIFLTELLHFSKA